MKFIFHLLPLALLLAPAPMRGQSATGCFEVKYLDFFEYDKWPSVHWPKTELDQLMALNFAQDSGQYAQKTNFFIPLLVMQLKDYHPACATKFDTATYGGLTRLYFKIRQQDMTTFGNMALTAQLEYIRQDYYSQVMSDSTLPYMDYTLDDGPFYGELARFMPKQAVGKTYKSEFGRLTIAKLNGKMFVTVFDRQNKHLWTRIMTGIRGRYLTNLSWAAKDIFKTSLGYTLRMLSGSERVRLYLKDDGSFRYYFCSW